MGSSSVSKFLLVGVLFSGAIVPAQELDLNRADTTPLVELEKQPDVVATDTAETSTTPAAKSVLVDAGLSEGPGDNAAESPDAAAEPSDEAEQLPPPLPVNDQVASEDLAPTQPETANVAAREEVRELDSEPLARGPIHEAFAEPLQNTPTPDSVVTKAPPAPVDEIAPTMEDERTNMQWIPGYWAWEPQSEDYVWISGVWRKTPKDRRWVAGRWEKVPQGYQWVPGAWLPTGGEDIVVKKEILPPPPESLENGPTSPAPSEQHFWIPGTWQRTPAATYAWRAGYWARSQKNWVWVPDHYVWDPAGCVFVPGYWDYPWERRGTLYAPCTFRNYRPGIRVTYRPTRVIDTDQWLVNLWMGPSSRSYYFGDYYDCTTLGYTPWYQYYGINRGYYDPFYSYYRWQFPTTYGIGLYGYLNQLHLYYGTHVGLRPAVRISPYRAYGSRGYVSLFGDVVRLSRIANSDLGRDRYGYRRDYLDDFYYRGRGRGDFRDDGRYGRNDGRDFRNRQDDRWRDLSPGRSRGDFDRDPNRRGRGNANVGDRDRDRTRDQRPDVDTLGPVRRTPGMRDANQAFRSRDPNRDGSRLPTADGRRRNDLSGSGANAEDRARAVRDAQPRSTGPVRNAPQSRATRQSNPDFSISGMKNARNREEVLRQRDAMQNWIQRNQRSQPATRNPAANRTPPALRQSGSTRSNVLRSPSPMRQPSATRSQPSMRSNLPRATTTPAPTPSRSAVRSNPVAPSRSAVQPRSQPNNRSRNPGFSISGMKNARNRADVQRQRDAMQNLIRERKGRK